MTVMMTLGGFSFAARLDGALKAMGRSKMHLSAAMGWTDMRVSQLLVGQGNITHADAEKIAVALKLPLGFLLGTEEWDGEKVRQGEPRSPHTLFTDGDEHFFLNLCDLLEAVGETNPDDIARGMLRAAVSRIEGRPPDSGRLNQITLGEKPLPCPLFRVLAENLHRTMQERKDPRSLETVRKLLLKPRRNVREAASEPEVNGAAVEKDLAPTAAPEEQLSEDTAPTDHEAQEETHADPTARQMKRKEKTAKAERVQANLLRFAKAQGMKQTHIGPLLGYSITFFHTLPTRRLNDTRLRTWEQKLGLPAGWLLAEDPALPPDVGKPHDSAPPKEERMSPAARPVRKAEQRQEEDALCDIAVLRILASWPPDTAQAFLTVLSNVEQLPTEEREALARILVNF